MKIKKSIAILLVLIIGICSIGNVSFAAQTEFEYELDSNSYATITAYHGTDSDITIPATIEGHQVNKIGEHAFDASYNETNGNIIENVVISEGITSIGDFAFVGCTNLESIKLPESLTNLGDQTFPRCTKLKSINIPSKITKFGYSGFMFQETAFSEFIIPENVKNIPSSTFRLCENLKKVAVYSKDIVYGGNDVFERCPDDLVLYGYPNSTTQTYAETNNIEFADISTYSAENNEENKYQGYTVLGKIQIPKIDIEYPILDKVTAKSLEIAVSLLYKTGEGLNKEGNVVIVGHNYRNGTLFSNLKNLSTGDEIYITDLDGNKEKYVVYKKMEANPEDTSFFTRETNGAKEITLSTPTDDTSKRTIILASNSPTQEQLNQGTTNNETKKTDDTVANKIIPKTGRKIWISCCMIILLIVVAILYKLNKKVL